MARPKHLKYIVLTYEILTSGLSDKEQKVLGNIIGVIQGGGTYRFDNRWIADFLCTHPNSVSRIISNLQKKGLVDVVLVMKEGTKAIDHRVISLTEMGINTFVNTPLNPSVNTPLNPSVKDNKKDNNTKDNNINISFDEIWNLYDYKTGTKEKLRKKWESLTDIEREKIKIHVPLYVKSTPDKQFRKHFQTYLNNCGWEDEILKVVKPKSKTNSVDVLTPILREIRRVGSYGKPEFKEYEKDAQQVARQLGWGNCCTMSEFDLKHNINNSISITQ